MIALSREYLSVLNKKILNSSAFQEKITVKKCRSRPHPALQAPLFPREGTDAQMDKLSDVLSESQKKNKITNLLSYLRIRKVIMVNEEKKWILVK
jgi:hypothetical protein